jgi:uncharacterized protein (DUF849 family)
MAAPVIIEAAINGIASKDRNPHVPCSPAEITRDALGCLAAGAAIVHSHNQDFAVGAERAAELYLAAWRPVLHHRPDAILYPTIGFGATMAERYGHHDILARAEVLRMGLLDPGSVNFGATDADGLPGPPDFVYANSFSDVRHAVEVCARHRLGPSISIFEPGFLRCALAYHRAGRLPPGALLKLYFGGDADYLGGGRRGVSFGLPPTRTALAAYLEMLGDCPVAWAVAVLGGDVVASGLARLALERGGHLRVGLEDYAGARTPTNEELVREAVDLARAVGRPVATAAEAGRILGLPR